MKFLFKLMMLFGGVLIFFDDYVWSMSHHEAFRLVDQYDASYAKKTLGGIDHLDAATRNLFYTTVYSDIFSVRDALSKDVNLSAVDSNGYSIVWRACCSCYDGQVLPFILRHIAATNRSLLFKLINQPSYNGATPLLAACALNNIDAARVLIEYDAAYSISSKANAYNMTVLFAACARGNPAMIALVLDHGASDQINTSDNDKITPLWLASRNGDRNLIRTLLTYGAGASIDQVDHSMHKSPLMLLLEGGKFDSALLLYAHGAKTLKIMPENLFVAAREINNVICYLDEHFSRGAINNFDDIQKYLRLASDDIKNYYAKCFLSTNGATAYLFRICSLHKKEFIGNFLLDPETFKVLMANAAHYGFCEKAFCHLKNFEIMKTKFTSDAQIS